MCVRVGVGFGFFSNFFLLEVIVFLVLVFFFNVCFGLALLWLFLVEKSFFCSRIIMIT